MRRKQQQAAAIHVLKGACSAHMDLPRHTTETTAHAVETAKHIFIIYSAIHIKST